MARPENARCGEQRSKNNPSSDQSRGIGASWEHETGESDLFLHKNVQQPLQAPGCGLQSFLCVCLIFFPLPEAVQQRAVCSSSQLSLSLCLIRRAPGKLGSLFLFLTRNMESSSNGLVPTLHFCKKIFAAALCMSVLLPESGLSKNLWKRALHLKRTEKYDDYEYPLHSHSAHYQKNDRCPPPPQTLPERACEVSSCRSDSECERHKRCCYNGCIYACLESVQPPPVLDWLVQPKPRWLGGNGWLLDGPEEVLQDGRNLRNKYYKEYFGSNSNNVVGYVKQQQKHLG
ncbi:WAP four-disulfide core domain protein 1 isoform X2 [Pelodiscus sinensis]|uniref:WAP four-disulfide core domain protein 1 isoform X2 n=1 Tax=Pelodiscus sinensis TaxID=13735 RepID=UPI003F6D0CA2